MLSKLMSLIRQWFKPSRRLRCCVKIDCPNYAEYLAIIRPAAEVVSADICTACHHNGYPKCICYMIATSGMRPTKQSREVYSCTLCRDEILSDKMGREYIRLGLLAFTKLPEGRHG